MREGEEGKLLFIIIVCIAYTTILISRLQTVKAFVMYSNVSFAYGPCLWVQVQSLGVTSENTVGNLCV